MQLLSTPKTYMPVDLPGGKIGYAVFNQRGEQEYQTAADPALDVYSAQMQRNLMLLLLETEINQVFSRKSDFDMAVKDSSQAITMTLLGVNRIEGEGRLLNPDALQLNAAHLSKRAQATSLLASQAIHRFMSEPVLSMDSDDSQAMDESDWRKDDKRFQGR
jgi:hypothetical protein